MHVQGHDAGKAGVCGSVDDRRKERTNIIPASSADASLGRFTGALSTRMHEPFCSPTKTASSPTTTNLWIAASIRVR